MTTPISRVIQRLLATCARDGMTDGELLTRFLSQRDEAALCGLVERQGPMVWGVCRRMLSTHDAEDAFQATFLVLVRKGATLPNRDTVGNWLYGVARQTAVRMRAAAAKLRRRETHLAVLPEPAAAEPDARDDLAPLLDEELSRLPEKYRAVVVLCDLEGMPRRDAARRLNIPEGTAASRLATARAMLARRLTRRGVVTPAAAGGALLAQHAGWAGVPAGLASRTIESASLSAAGHAAAGVIPAQVAALTEGVVRAMFVSKIKSVLAAAVVGVALCGATGLICRTEAGDEPKPRQAPVEKKTPDQDQSPDEPKRKPAKTDLEKLQGTWRATSSIQNGSEVAVDNELTFDGERLKWTIRVKERTDFSHTSEGRFRLIEEATPKAMELIGADPKKKREAIYRIDGDTFIFCMHGTLAKRPEKFESEWGTDVNIFTFKRVAAPEGKQVPRDR